MALEPWNYVANIELSPKYECQRIYQFSDTQGLWLHGNATMLKLHIFI